MGAGGGLFLVERVYLARRDTDTVRYSGIGMVDNVLRPVLVGKDTKMPDYLILVSTLGGLAVFGLNGFVIGPLIAALFMSSWGIFVGTKRQVRLPQDRN